MKSITIMLKHHFWTPCPQKTWTVYSFCIVLRDPIFHCCHRTATLLWINMNSYIWSRSLLQLEIFFCLCFTRSLVYQPPATFGTLILLPELYMSRRYSSVACAPFSFDVYFLKIEFFDWKWWEFWLFCLFVVVLWDFLGKLFCRRTQIYTNIKVMLCAMDFEQMFLRYKV